jgi:hypothetical protein
MDEETKKMLERIVDRVLGIAGKWQKTLRRNYGGKKT